MNKFEVDARRSRETTFFTVTTMTIAQRFHASQSKVVDEKDQESPSSLDMPAPLL